MVDKIAHYGDRAVVTKINEVIDALTALQTGGSVDWGSIQNIPAALTTPAAAGTPSIRAIGTTATTAAAGNHTHTGLMSGSAVAQAASVAADVPALLTDFNALLTKLRNRGVIS
jgi:hypothetical protein